MASPRRRLILQLLRWTVSVAVMVFAVWVIFKELGIYRYQPMDILQKLIGLPAWRLISAIAAIFLSYLCQMQFDVLGLRYLHKTLPRYAMLIGAFVGQCMTINTNAIVGNTARWRMYRHHGLTLAEVTTITTFSFGSFLLGFLLLGAIVYLTGSSFVSPLFVLPTAIARTVGMLCLALLGLYIAASALHIRVARLRRWSMTIPPTNIAILQILYSTFDWLLVAFALFMLLPFSSLSLFPYFLAIYLGASLVGQISQAPSGLGVFEAAMLSNLSPLLPADSVIGALLIYRVFYNFFPLMLTLVLLGLREILHLRSKFNVE